MTKQAIIKSNLSEDIYHSLKQGIMSGDIPPETRLKQQEIASAFGASLIPVREAFKSLEKEGLIVLSANKGATVSAISSDEAGEVFELRLILEQSAIVMAMRNDRLGVLKKAESILEAMDQTEDVSELSSLNKAFHQCLYIGCGNQRLIDMIDKQYETIDRYMQMYLTEEDNHLFSQNTHYILLKAIREGDEEAVQDLLKAHMTTAKNKLIDDIEQRRS